MNILEIKLAPDAELAVVKAEVSSMGGNVFRPKYFVNFFNSRGTIVDRFEHSITDREWNNWGINVYDRPYLKQIILKRYEQKNGGIYLSLASDDDLQTAVDPDDNTVLMIDEFNSYSSLIDDIITAEVAEQVAAAAAAAPTP